jgi:hypothetical protein
MYRSVFVRMGLVRSVMRSWERSYRFLGSDRISSCVVFQLMLSPKAARMHSSVLPDVELPSRPAEPGAVRGRKALPKVANIRELRTKKAIVASSSSLLLSSGLK